jgi:hypothetical protein
VFAGVHRRLAQRRAAHAAPPQPPIQPLPQES